jgi:hypothetical protein
MFAACATHPTLTFPILQQGVHLAKAPPEIMVCGLR